MKKSFFAVVAMLAVAACSQSNTSTQTGSTAAPGSPEPSPTNATGFPLFAESTVLASKVWSEKTQAQHYAGLEVVASTPATLDKLGVWIKGLSTNPPAGYSVAASGSGVESAHARAAKMGVDFQVFDHQVDGKHHATIVLAIDPAVFDRQAGPMLGALDKYKMLPQALRDPIDAQVKARTGFTVSEALSPNTPIGAAVAAVNQLRSTGQRGVVLVDGAKQ